MDGSYLLSQFTTMLCDDTRFQFAPVWYNYGCNGQGQLNIGHIFNLSRARDDRGCQMEWVDPSMPVGAGDPEGEGTGEAAAPNETKHERFVRIAERRTQQVLEKLRILGNCSNRGIYEFSEEEVEKIFRAVLRQVEITRAQFEDRAKRVEFKL